ncbi:unnamed protein product [Symbiodinium microadriaticum]|nr:unnamed protein product [Symbiodinium microadriaticum]
MALAADSPASGLKKAMPALSGECLKENGPNGWRKPAVKEDGSGSNSSSTTSGCEPSVCEESEATKVARDGSGSSSGSRTETVKAYKESTQDESSSSASRSEQAQDVQDGDPPKQLNSLKTAHGPAALGEGPPLMVVLTKAGPMESVGSQVQLESPALPLHWWDGLSMQYQERLEAKAGDAHGDLLDFEDGSAGSEPATSSQASAPYRNEALPGFVPETLWAGDTVLARYGPNGRFFRARVVRVYSSRGSSLADVEWLRTQDSRSGDEFLGPLQDELLHRNGLQVGTEVRALASSGSARSSAAAGVPGPTAPAQEGPPAAAMPDLLDFSPLGEAVPSGADFLAPAGDLTPGLPRLDFSGARPVEAQRPPSLIGGGYGNVPVQDFTRDDVHAKLKEMQKAVRARRRGAFGRAVLCLVSPLERSPQRRVAALEMLGTLVLTADDQDERLPIIPLLEDNHGNLNSKSRKMPSAAILMELMLLLHRNGCTLAPLTCTYHRELSKAAGKFRLCLGPVPAGIGCAAACAADGSLNPRIKRQECAQFLRANDMAFGKSRGEPNRAHRVRDEAIELYTEASIFDVLSCAYCHLFHQSRLKQRREDVSSSPAQRQTFAVRARVVDLEAAFPRLERCHHDLLQDPALGGWIVQCPLSFPLDFARSSTPIVAEDDSETRQVSTAASTNEAWAEPRGAAAAPPPPGGAAPTRQWQEAMSLEMEKAMDSLQREYAEALKSIDFRVNQRMTSLRSQLDCAVLSDYLATSCAYCIEVKRQLGFPAEVSRGETDAEMVDPELISP